MERIRIVKVLAATEEMENVTIMGWVRTKRDSKDFSFLEINDGSCLKNIQVLVSEKSGCSLENIATGAAVRITGRLVASLGKGQKWEIQASEVEIFGEVEGSFPLQKKRHSDEFLRTIAHLRPRTNKYGALNRIRSRLAFAIHEYFNRRDFFYLHSPLITGSDCEGAGEMFQVTTLFSDKMAFKNGVADLSQDFFGKQAALTVSGQLSAECLACAIGNVYTFGPTFRAENSNTARHAAEFWMVEPEMAFADLHDIIDLGEDLVVSMIRFVLNECEEDFALFANFVDRDLRQTLENIADGKFVRISYSEAIKILSAAKEKFQYPVQFGLDLQTEHERYLTEKHFGKPVAVYDYPKDIKAFYMRLNDDGKTVAAVDILVPRIGELIGGSQREERFAVLEQRMVEQKMNLDEYWWYTDLRRYGTIPHAGFGLGFERLLMLVTGIGNIRDVLPFPRTVNHLEF